MDTNTMPEEEILLQNSRTLVKGAKIESLWGNIVDLNDDVCIVNAGNGTLSFYGNDNDAFVKKFGSKYQSAFKNAIAAERKLYNSIEAQIRKKRKELVEIRENEKRLYGKLKIALKQKHQELAELRKNGVKSPRTEEAMVKQKHQELAGLENSAVELLKARAMVKQKHQELAGLRQQDAGRSIAFKGNAFVAPKLRPNSAIALVEKQQPVIVYARSKSVAHRENPTIADMQALYENIFRCALDKGVKKIAVPLIGIHAVPLYMTLAGLAQSYVKYDKYFDNVFVSIFDPRQETEREKLDMFMYYSDQLTKALHDALNRSKYDQGKGEFGATTEPTVSTSLAGQGGTRSPNQVGAVDRSRTRTLSTDQALSNIHNISRLNRDAAEAMKGGTMRQIGRSIEPADDSPMDGQQDIQRQRDNLMAPEPAASARPTPRPRALGSMSGMANIGDAGQDRTSSVDAASRHHDEEDGLSANSEDIQRRIDNLMTPEPAASARPTPRTRALGNMGGMEHIGDAGQDRTSSVDAASRHHDAEDGLSANSEYLRRRLSRLRAIGTVAAVGTDIDNSIEPVDDSSMEHNPRAGQAIDDSSTIDNESDQLSGMVARRLDNADNKLHLAMNYEIFLRSQDRRGQDIAIATVALPDDGQHMANVAVRQALEEVIDAAAHNMDNSVAIAEIKLKAACLLCAMGRYADMNKDRLMQRDAGFTKWKHEMEFQRVLRNAYVAAGIVFPVNQGAEYALLASLSASLQRHAFGKFDTILGKYYGVDVGARSHRLGMLYYHRDRALPIEEKVHSNRAVLQSESPAQSDLRGRLQSYARDALQQLRRVKRKAKRKMKGAIGTMRQIGCNSIEPVDDLSMEHSPRAGQARDDSSTIDDESDQLSGMVGRRLDNGANNNHASETTNRVSFITQRTEIADSGRDSSNDDQTRQPAPSRTDVEGRRMASRDGGNVSVRGRGVL